MSDNFDPNQFPSINPFDDEGDSDDHAGGPYHGSAPGGHVSAGDAFAEGFLNLESSESAGDFLGLDTDMVSSASDDHYGGPMDVHSAGGYGTQGQYGAPAGQAYAPPAQQGYGAPAQQGYADPGYGSASSAAYEDEYQDYQSAEDYDDEFGEPGLELEPAESSGSSIGGLLLGVVVVGAVGAGAWFFLPKFLGKSAPVEIARPTGTTPVGVKPNTGSTPSGATGTTTPGDTTPRGQVGVEQFARDEVVPRPEDFRVEDIMLPWTIDGKPSTDTRVTSTREPGSRTTRPTGSVTSPGTGATGSVFDNPTAVNVDGVVLDPEVFTTDAEWGQGDELDMIWRGTSVPLSAVFGNARVSVPRVGAVRVFMESGAVFEGRLLAVGQSRVWVDMPTGEIGLDGESVVRVERLASLGDAGTGRLPQASGRKVRVLLPGGAIYGRVISVIGEQVVIATDEGGRITVRDAQIEEVVHARAVVIETPYARVPDQVLDGAGLDDFQVQEDEVEETPTPDDASSKPAMDGSSGSGAAQGTRPPANAGGQTVPDPAQGSTDPVGSDDSAAPSGTSPTGTPDAGSQGTGPDASGSGNDGAAENGSTDPAPAQGGSGSGL